MYRSDLNPSTDGATNGNSIVQGSPLYDCDRVAAGYVRCAGPYGKSKNESENNHARQYRIADAHLAGRIYLRFDARRLFEIRAAIRRSSIPASFRGSPAPRKYSPVLRAQSLRHPIRGADRRCPGQGARGRWMAEIRRTAHLRILDANQRTISLKKGPFALGCIHHDRARAGQRDQRAIQRCVLKNDLPFPKDATDIEFDPNKPLLMLVSAEPIDKTLDFYRKELSPLGWSLWSQKLNGVQPAGGRRRANQGGAYAYYLQGDRRLASLVLERADAGGTKVNFEELPAGYLASLERGFFNSDNTGAALVDVHKLPRLEGAKEDPARSSSDRSVYSVARPLAETTTALTQMLAADGWKQYVAPLEEIHTTLLNFKKGPQGLSVSFTIQVGKNERTSEETTVYYSPTRLNFALRFLTTRPTSCSTNIGLISMS